MRKTVVLLLVLAAAATPVGAQVSLKPGKAWQPSKPKAEGPELKTDRSEYRHALAVYQAGQTAQACRLCDQVVKTYKSGEWVERAALLKARAYFKEGKTKQADRELTLVRSRYPGTFITREISDLQIAIGTAYIEKGKYAGVKILEEMVENNPYGPRADEAQFKIGEYYLRKGDHLDAAQAFALVLAQYKDSRYREDAMFLRAKMNYLDNEGPRRDPLPYEEARVGLNDYLNSYPRGKHADEAKALLEKIETALARKHYLTAEYYRGQRQRRAAERYYRYVVQNYPNSTWAQKALKRLPKQKRPAAPAPEAPPRPDTPETAGKPEPPAPPEPAQADEPAETEEPAQSEEPAKTGEPAETEGTPEPVEKSGETE